MRLLVWILGVICTLHALMVARAIAPAWVWVFWLWLVLWAMVGLVVVIAAAVRLANAGVATGRRGSVPQRSVPPSVAPGGE